MENPSNPRKRKLSLRTKHLGLSNEELSRVVEDLFSKRYEIINENYQLPRPEDMFLPGNWGIDDLQRLKVDLNNTKSRLNDFSLTEWQQHTRKRNKAGEVLWRLRRDVDPEFLTQAWCKFYENVSAFPLVPPKCRETGKLNSLHLCEAPGAFVTSLNHYLRLNAPGMRWKWLATTLNPHYEGNSLSTMINDDRLILHTQEQWFFGADGTGDIMRLENLDELVGRAREMGEVALITADGSISCIDAPDEQESIVTRLHLCEVIAALHILEASGSLLLKVFTVFETQTVCLMFLLTCLFERIVMNKPATSKEGNSEVYVVCLGFRGREGMEGQLEVLRREYEGENWAPMFRKCDVPEGFVRQIYRAGESFMEKQCEVIEGNVAGFGAGEGEEVRRVRRAVAEEFVRRYGVEKIEDGMEVVGKRLGMFGCEVMESRFSEDSYNDRKRKEEMGVLERLGVIEEESERIWIGEERFVFRLSGDPGPLKTTLGKPYETIESSRFCVAKILKNFNSVRRIREELTLNVEFPDKKITEKFVEEMKMKSKRVHCFEYSPKMNIKLIHGIIKDTREGETIIFFGYCLLTQLNVGILYILAHAFETLELQLDDDLGCLITLNNLKKNERVTETIGKILEASEKAKENNQIVISMFPIIKLCACELYQAILKINHGTIKKFIHHVVKKVNS